MDHPQLDAVPQVVISVFHGNGPLKSEHQTVYHQFSVIITAQEHLIPVDLAGEGEGIRQILGMPILQRDLLRVSSRSVMISQYS